MIDLTKELSSNAYPGRGIVIGKSADSKNAVIIYFIMGRSENSRNRIFELNDRDMKTKAFDESKLSDPSLIIYSPVRVYENKTIVTNGDQTDTIYDFLADGKGFCKALKTREFEPDAPNYTPRISGMICMHDGDFKYKMSILKSADGNPDCCNRYFYNYSPIAGEGKFIHTYKQDGDPIPSFEGEPKTVAIGNDINETANNVWNALNEENKVSLFVRYIPLNGEEESTVIINKNK